ncbi:MAG: transcriptional regulator [Parcubacteria group bacterium GW2011_GWA2_47_26]|nr:MAG: transcriptional regulator [Parcubacteria group bacterium GW2011_GWA2_47_26]
MSRHSHWAKVKHGKGTADQKRGALFSKLSRMITVAARSGGDPSMNFRLRLAIDHAKAAAMTKDTIERAIAKGTGADKEGLQITEEIYEGFGPSGIALLIEVVTDNKNRAFQELKHAFSKHGGSLGSSGSVAWMFEHKGVIRLPPPHPASGIPIPGGEGRVRADQDLEFKLIDAGAEDIASEDEGVTVYTKPEELKAVEEKIRAAGLIPEYTGLAWVAKDAVKPPEEARGQLEALQDALDEMEDVSEYYTNAAEEH